MIMTEYLKDWRAWFVALIAGGYILAMAAAWPDRSMPKMSDAEIDAIIDHHIANCDLMGEDGYADQCPD